MNKEQITFELVGFNKSNYEKLMDSLVQEDDYIKNNCGGWLNFDTPNKSTCWNETLLIKKMIL